MNKIKKGLAYLGAAAALTGLNAKEVEAQNKNSLQWGGFVQPNFSTSGVVSLDAGYANPDVRNCKTFNFGITYGRDLSKEDTSRSTRILRRELIPEVSGEAVFSRNTTREHNSTNVYGLKAGISGFVKGISNRVGANLGVGFARKSFTEKNTNSVTHYIHGEKIGTASNPSNVKNDILNLGYVGLDLSAGISKDLDLVAGFYTGAIDDQIRFGVRFNGLTKWSGETNQTVCDDCDLEDKVESN